MKKVDIIKEILKADKKSFDSVLEDIKNKEIKDFKTLYKNRKIRSNEAKKSILNDFIHKWELIDEELNDLKVTSFRIKFQLELKQILKDVYSWYFEKEE